MLDNVQKIISGKQKHNLLESDASHFFQPFALRFIPKNRFSVINL